MHSFAVGLQSYFDQKPLHFFACSPWRPNEFESGGGCIGPEQSARKKILLFPSTFGSKSTISRFGEGFRDGQYSLVSLLFAVLLLTVPPVPSRL